MNTHELMQKVAEVEPVKYDFLLKTAAEIRSSPFRDQIVGELDHIIKTAISMSSVGGAIKSGFGKFMGSKAGDAALYGATITGLGVAASLAGDLADAAHRGITKSRNYKAMMEANPDLKKEDPVAIQSHFNTLHRFNPEFSSDPNVAGSYVRSQSQFPEGDLGSVQGLVSSRKAIKDARGARPLGGMPWQQTPSAADQAQQTQQFEIGGHQNRKLRAEANIAERNWQNEGVKK